MGKMTRKTAAVAAAMIAGLTLGTGAAGAQAMPGTGSLERPSDTSIVNGVAMLGCQYLGGEIISYADCANFEQLTTDDPALLKVDPIGTSIVALGAGLEPDGSIPPVLEERLKTTYRIAQNYPMAPIVVTGGVPKNGTTEADAMYHWLVGAGIDPGRITIENRSGSTVQNAQYSNSILQDQGARGAVIVTNDFHLKRAMTNFREVVGARIPVAGVVAAP